MLTVESIFKDKKGSKYHCVCDCGKETDARGYDLHNGKKWCCGCLTNDTRPYRRKDYTGQKFGKLTVIEMLMEDNPGSKSRSKCKCICECGSTTIKDAYEVSHGKITSCGCDSRERTIAGLRKDLTGQKFGRLTVLEMLWNYNGGHTHCRCICDCGEETIVLNTELTGGGTQSCGCYQKERAAEANRKDYTGMSNAYGTTLLRRTAERDAQGIAMWECRCGGCGAIFIAPPCKILNGHIASCGCVKSSVAEIVIRDILHDLDVEFIPEYRFDDCCDKRPLPFDFYLPQLNRLIEYNGQQHYKSVELFGGDEAYQLRIEHDRVKREYCKEHNIPLLDLPYSLTHQEIKEQIIDFINA